MCLVSSGGDSDKFKIVRWDGDHGFMNLVS